METQQPMDSQPEKKKNTLLIITAVVIVLCCCCLVASAAGYYAYNKSKTGQFDFSPSDTFTPIPPILDEPATDVPGSISDIGEPPTGGLGNDVLIRDTWNTLAPAAVGLGCDKPLGTDTTIDVIEQPDANGRWVEHWKVACQSGKKYTFEVEFLLDATGATFNIKYLP